jgi:hypothetical protein
MSGLGDGGEFLLAGSCPVAEQWANGEYMSHQGDPDDYLVADAATRGGSASARIALWRCVHCGTLVVGLATCDDEPSEDQDFTWLQQQPR